MSNNLLSIFAHVAGAEVKSMQFLVKALEKNNLPGFDYLEFKQSIQALSNMNMDEATAFKSTFATASIAGLTKEKLLETADYYKTVLVKEKGQFDSALQTQMHQRVTSKEEDVKKWTVQIARWQEQIKELEKSIQEAGSEIENSRLKIEETRASFESTFELIINEIIKDVQNIKNHIQ